MPLSGFTLFKVSRGWQLSTRDEREVGWSVQIVPDDVAQKILSGLDDTVPPLYTDVPVQPVRGLLDLRRDNRTPTKKNPPSAGRVRL